MCEHNGQLKVYDELMHDDATVRIEYGHCPDCDARMFERRVYTQSGETIYGDVDPVWHGKMMQQAAEQINELMAVVADNARKRAVLEAEYREQLNAANRQKEAAEQTASARLSLLTSIRIRLIEISTDLARSGDYDHRDKNAAILRVLTTMLAMSRWKSSNEAHTSPDDSDVPF